MLGLACLWWSFALLWVKGYPDSAVLWRNVVMRSAMGMLILVPAWMSAVYLLSFPPGGLLLVVMVIVVAAADIGAYFSGRRFGKHKLAVLVSPAKTWEGFWGGVTACISAGSAAVVSSAGARGSYRPGFGHGGDRHYRTGLGDRRFDREHGQAREWRKGQWQPAAWSRRRVGSTGQFVWCGAGVRTGPAAGGLVVMAASKRLVSVLGSTGSIGINTLDVIARHPERFEVYALAAHSSVDAMLAQCLAFAPRYAVMMDEAAATLLRQRLPSGAATEVKYGESGLADIVTAPEVDVVMAAIVGAAGLPSTLAAARAGKTLLLANKESLVMGGHLLMQAVREAGARLLPIDSEHNAIFQCMPVDAQATPSRKGVSKVLLTASGGPFRRWSLAQMFEATPDQACAHPNWSMGRKISVDSASLMNKGLEFIEACWIFDLAPEQVDVVVHPQSIIHSMVQYLDGSVLAQMGNPDMRTAIAYGLGWPERLASGVAPLDLVATARLDFEAPDETRFPCLRLARESVAVGGTAMAVCNAANEVAVAAFLDKKIRFTDIPAVIEHTLERADIVEPTDFVRGRRSRCPGAGACIWIPGRSATAHYCVEASLMELFYTIALTLGTLAVLVAIHEFGHFWVARRCGVQVLRFSIGFGTSLFSWRDRQGTEYSIAAIPLGGYVKMLDEREGEVPASELHRAFNRKPPLQRIAVVSAGPLANLLLAVVAYWFLYMAGESGYVPIIGEVEPDSVAAVAGLEAGQEIVAVDGGETPTWQALSFRLLDRIGDTGTIKFAVQYPDSGVVYESEASINRWLADQEEPDLYAGLGISLYAPEVPPVVGEVVAESPAAKIGMLPGDKVLRVDGVTMALWMDWVDYVRARPAAAN